MVAFQGNIISLINYNSTFGNDAFCVSIVEYHSSIASNLESLNADFTFYVSLSNNSVFELTIDLDFSFNSSLEQFELNSTSLYYQLIYTSNLTISSLTIAEKILVMQSD